jgi:tRNA(Arg) A34 adenosine deaminase TadA
MSKRYTQANRVVWALNNGKEVWNKGRGLEVFNDSYEPTIKYNGTIVGHMLNKGGDYDDYDPDCPEYNVIALTLQEFLLPERVRKQLVLEANANELLVVFVPMIDIGFGVPEPVYKPTKDFIKTLEKVAKYSQDDVKTAAFVAHSQYHNSVTLLHDPIMYSCNQLLEGHSDKFHAEATLAMVSKIIGKYALLSCVSTLEPCYDCLTELISCGASRIVYIVNHKDKWNTPEYIQLVNDIRNRTVRTERGWPVTYKKEDTV